MSNFPCSFAHHTAQRMHQYATNFRECFVARRTFARFSMANENMWKSSSLTGMKKKSEKIHPDGCVEMPYIFATSSRRMQKQRKRCHIIIMCGSSVHRFPFHLMGTIRTYQMSIRISYNVRGRQPHRRRGKMCKKYVTRAFPSFVEFNANFGHEYWIWRVRVGVHPVEPHPIIHESICEHWTNYVMAINVRMWKMEWTGVLRVLSFTIWISIKIEIHRRSIAKPPLRYESQSRKNISHYFQWYWFASTNHCGNVSFALL